jgi:hypothetical protein
VPKGADVVVPGESRKASGGNSTGWRFRICWAAELSTSLGEPAICSRKQNGFCGGRDLDVKPCGDLSRSWQFDGSRSESDQRRDQDAGRDKDGGDGLS